MGNIAVDFFTLFLQKFLEIVLPILAVALAGLVTAWITKLVAEIKIKTGNKYDAILDDAVQVAVMAAEQMDLKSKLEDKKATAIEIAQNYLDAHGIVNVNLKVLDDKIEAAVMANFNIDKTTPEAVPSQPVPVQETPPPVPTA
jgi:hypothetical protein